MSESQAPSRTAANPGETPEQRAERRRLKRRYRVDRRFKWYGVVALTLAMLFLAYFLFDIISRGHSAFVRHEIRATLVINEDTVTDRRDMVEGVMPEVISTAGLLDTQLSALRYEIRLPVALTPDAVDRPAEAIREGVRRRAERERASLRAELAEAEAAGSRRVRRIRRQIEQLEEAAERIEADAAAFVDLDRFVSTIRSALDAGDEPRGEAGGGAGDGAGRPRVELLWAPLSGAASRYLLDAPNDLSGQRQEALKNLVFFHLRRLADDYYRRQFNAEAVEGEGRREAWLVAASDVDLVLKGKPNRITNAAEEYERAMSILGLEPTAEPDPFAVMAAGFAVERRQASRYALWLEAIGVEPTASPTVAELLAAASQHRGEPRSAEAFAELVEAGGKPLAEAMRSLKLPPRQSDAPFRLLEAMLDERLDEAVPSADMLRVYAADWDFWHDADERMLAISKDAGQLERIASGYFPGGADPDDQAYAALMGHIGVEPGPSPDPVAVLAGVLDRVEARAHNPENMQTLISQWTVAQHIDELVAEDRTRATFNAAFFTNTGSRRPEVAGLWNAAVGSVFLLITVLLVAFPIGVLTAVYLEEFAPDNWFTRTVEVNINNLAAVPSILFGLLGLAVFINLVGLPRSGVIVGGLTLSLMALPVIIIATRAALSAVPDSIRQGAQAMGATRWQAVTHHVLPQAMPGILTGTIIALAQAIGETAPLIIIGMVGFITTVPSGPLDTTTALPAQIFTWFGDSQSGFSEKAAAGIMVLLAVLLSMNALAIFLRARFEKKW